MDDSNNESGEALAAPSAKARGKRCAHMSSNGEEDDDDDEDNDDDEDDRDTNDDEDGANENTRPYLSEQASGKQPRRALNSSQSSLTPITPDTSQSTSASSRKRQRESKKISPRKRGRVDSDDEYIDSSVYPSRSLVATRPRRQKCPSTRVAESPIEIFDSSEDDIPPPARQALARSSAYTRREHSKSTQHVQSAARCASASRGADLELIPEIEPPRELVAAFQILWTARREVSKPPLLVAKANTNHFHPGCREVQLARGYNQGAGRVERPRAARVGGPPTTRSVSSSRTCETTQC